MAEFFGIASMIGESKAGPAGMLSCGRGYAAVARSTSRGTRRDSRMPVLRNVTSLGDGEPKVMLDWRRLPNSGQWKTSWEPVDGKESCARVPNLRTGRRLAGRCSSSSQSSETFDIHKNRGKLPVFVDVDIRDLGVLIGNGSSQGSCSPDKSRRSRKAQQENSNRAAYDEEELTEDENWDSEYDYGIDLTRKAGRESVQSLSMAKDNERQTSFHDTNPAVLQRDHQSSPPSSRRKLDVEENEPDSSSFFRGREFEVRRDKGRESNQEDSEDRPRYSGNPGYQAAESRMKSSSLEELIEKEEEGLKFDRETSGSFISQSMKDKDDPRDVRAFSGRIQTDQIGRGTKDDLIRRRLQAMEQEEADGSMLLSFGSKDNDVSGWRAIKKVDTALAKFPDGPILARSSLLAKQVISQGTAMSLGFVVQIWVEMDPWKVVAVEVRPSLLFGLVEAILLQNLSQVGDVILVPDEDALEGELDWTGCEPVVGFDIFTENALYLGKVRDFEFNLDNGRVTTLEFDSFGVPLIPSSVVSTFSLPVSEIVETGEDCLLVRAGAEKRMQVLSKGLWGRLSGDGPPSKGAKTDSRLVPRSGARRSPQSREGTDRLSRADISRAQEVADIYVSSRRSKGYRSRGVQQEPPKDIDAYISKPTPRTPNTGQGQVRRSGSRTRDMGPGDEEFDI